MTITLSPLDRRIPSWKIDDLVERNCPICNTLNKITSYIRPDLLEVKYCTKCSSYYISPAPSEKQLAEFYSTYDMHHRIDSTETSIELLNIYQQCDPFSDVRIRELSSFFKFKGSKVLDVGFGRAQFLFQLYKLGAIPFGVELDEYAIENAKRLGISNIEIGTLSSLPITTRFDLIVLNDLIEHPLLPLQLLESASNLLNKDGLILIWTPNGGIIKTEINPITFRVDLEHMQYFTTKSCQYLADKLNLNIIHLETLGFPILDGIITQISNTRIIIRKVIRFLKRIPGSTGIIKFKKRIIKPTQNDDRLGSYHLFCILQKDQLFDNNA